MQLKKVGILTLAIVSSVAIAQSVISTPPPPVPTLPPVTATAPAGSGSNVLCTGEACGWVLDALSARWTENLLSQNLPLEDLVVNKTEFCNELRKGTTSPRFQ